MRKMKTPKKIKLNEHQITKLQDEVLELRDLLHTVQSGEIDALVVKNKFGEESIFTLEGEEQPYRLLVESLSEGALTLDNENKIIHCNRKFAIMVNRSVENIIGSSIFNHITAVQRQRLRKLLSAKSNAIPKKKFTLLVKNNQTKVVLLSCNTIKLGSIHGTSIVITDITELANEFNTRLKIQKKLVQQEVLFRHLTENTNDVFWIMTSTVDKILYISPGYEKVWGRSIKNLYVNTMEWMESILEEDKKNVLEFFTKLKNQEFAYATYRILRPDGEKKNIFVKGFQNKNKHGKVIDVFGIASDITELTTANAKVHLNDKLATLGTLAAGVAHEINNPISWIRGNLSYIKKNASSLASSKLEELIDESLEGVDRIIDIVGNLKGFSRIEDKAITLIDLPSAIDLALKIASSAIKSHAILEKNYAENLPLIEGSLGKIQQVFLNLIMNALQAMNKDTMQYNILRITTAQEANRIRIEVSDTGSGITAGDLLKIFDPFFTTKGKKQGTGLGLSISLEIIKAHGGDITVKSVVGQGTTFTVYFPISVLMDSNK